MENEEIKKVDDSQIEEVTKTDKKQQQNDSIPSSSDGVGEIADMIVDAMPDVQEHAINHKAETDKKRADKYAHLKDVQGVSFDAKIHKTKANGEPTLTKKGNLIRRPESEIAKSEAKESGASSSFVGGKKPEVKAIKPEVLQARAVGKISANMLFSFGMAIGGDEWLPVSNEEIGLNEREYVEGAFADYFESTGRTDLPPSFILMSAIGAYMIPRFTMPKTQTRLGKIKTFFVKWYTNRKLKKYGLQAQEVDEKTS